MKETINITPTWETTAKTLLFIIKQSPNQEDKTWAEGEVVRMGSIIDQQQKNTKELLESIWVPAEQHQKNSWACSLV